MKKEEIDKLENEGKLQYVMIVKEDKLFDKTESFNRVAQTLLGWGIIEVVRLIINA